MSLLSPIFKVEAALKALLCGVDPRGKAQMEIDAAKKITRFLSTRTLFF
jgi:hypothetical protein